MDAQKKKNHRSSVGLAGAIVIYLIIWLGLCVAFAFGIGRLNLPSFWSQYSMTLQILSCLSWGIPRNTYPNELVSVGAVTLLFPLIIMVLLYVKGVLPRRERQT